MSGELDVHTDDIVTVAGIQRRDSLEMLAIRNDATSVTYSHVRVALFKAIVAILGTAMTLYAGGIVKYVGVVFVAMAAWFIWKWWQISQAEKAVAATSRLQS
jgi:hypothetical protein